MLPPALRQQLLRKRRRPEGAATCLALSLSISLHLSASSFHHKHTHTHTFLNEAHTNTHWGKCVVRFIRNWQAACAQMKHSKINHEAEFLIESLVCSSYSEKMFIKSNYLQFNGNEMFCPSC